MNRNNDLSSNGIVRSPRGGERRDDSPRIRIVSPPQRAAGAALVAAVAMALGSPAGAAPGDLDASFGDIGRAVLPAPPYLTAWTAELLDDDSIVFGGGDEYCDYYYGCYENGFTGRLSDDGTPDAAFGNSSWGSVQVSDLAVQADQKIVGVGHSSVGDARGLVVFRMLPDGSPDAGFPTNGLQVLAEPPGEQQSAGTVVIDDQQRIVIAGTRAGRLLVVRLLDDGTLDLGFGTAGVYVGEPSSDVHSLPRIALASGGGYRVLFNSNGCKVLALTSGGAVDAAFGTAGTSGATGADSQCNSMAVQGDGKLLLGGGSGASAAAWRLLATGAVDGTFSSAAVADLLAEATTLTAGPAGKVLIAGRAKDADSAGAVVRLQASGAADATFGSAGIARFDLRTPYGSYPVAREMKLLSNGRLLLAGRAYLDGTPRPFFVRLLGDGESGAGVFAVTSSYSNVTEADGQAVVTVRRLGGVQGAVSVQYDTVPADPVSRATSGTDFTATTGRLQWADGDAADKQVVVPIAADSSALEAEEYFAIALSDPQGGAGLGTFKHQVAIRGDGYPAGAIVLMGGAGNVKESPGTFRYTVKRENYAHGAVSVTFTVSGTATAGVDYTGGASQVLTWEDGDSSSRFVDVVVQEDDQREADETVIVTLSNPTGGAVMSGSTSTTLTIIDEDKKGGGGAFGALGAALLGMVGIARRFRRRS